jgi:hypothetical protein
MIQVKKFTGLKSKIINIRFDQPARTWKGMGGLIINNQ